MAKRFTDTEKYDRAWFRRLPCRLKVAWDWLCCNVDKIGAWNIDMEKLSFEVGEPITLLELQEHFKVEVFDTDKLFIPGFAAFQYGDASGCLTWKSQLHKDIAERMEVRGFTPPSFRDAPPSEQNCPIPIDTHPPGTPPPTGVGRGRSRGRRSNSINTQNHAPPASFDFEALYKKYPRRLNPSAAKKRFEQVIQSQEDYAAFSLAIDRYTAFVLKNKTEDRYIKHMTTFIEDRESKPYTQPWRDWLDPDHGKRPAKSGAPNPFQQSLQKPVKEESA